MASATKIQNSEFYFILIINSSMRLMATTLGSTSPDAAWLGFHPPRPGCRASDLFPEHIPWDSCKGNEYMEGFPVAFCVFLLACFTKWGFLLCCVSPLAFVTCESGGAAFPGYASRAAPLVLTLARSSLNEGVVGSSVLGVPVREAWRGTEERGRGVLGQSWGRAAHRSHSAGTGERPEPRHHTQMTATTFPVSSTPMYDGIHTHPYTAHGMLPCSYF